MNIRNWNRALLTVVLILLSLVGLVLIKVLFHGGSKLEWGSLSDMVSAACNVAMAGAAVYAAWNARDWFTSKIYESAFKVAEELKDDLESLSRSIDINNKIILSRINFFIKHPSIKTCDDASDYWLEYREYLPKINDLRRKMAKIESLGMIIKEKKLLKEIIDNCEKYYISTILIFRYQSELRYEEQSIDNFRYQEEINSLSAISELVNEHVTKLDRFEFHNLFQPRKTIRK
ncbi:hypothetical protein F3J34_11440 [Klebsiella sp. Ap-873]|nr:hypothetical protein [Klebsiella sp. Ap-873]